MQVRVAVRQIGPKNIGANVTPPEEVEQDLANTYPNYDLKDSHYLGEVKDSMGNVLGWKVMFVMVRKEIPFREAVLTGSDNAEAPAKRGRPAKVQ